MPKRYVTTSRNGTFGSSMREPLRKRRLLDETLRADDAAREQLAGRVQLVDLDAHPGGHETARHVHDMDGNATG
jgi:hypothetical protein